MNLGEILTNVKSECGFATNIDTLVRRWANRGQQKFVSSATHHFSWMILNKLTLTMESNVGEYVLSPLVDTSKFINIYSSERRWTVRVVSRREFQERFPDASLITGDPVIAYLSGYSAVSRQPTSASQVTVVSTASDTAVITIEGLNADGILIREEITLDGTNPVISANSFTKILSRSFNAFIAGIVTMTSNGGAVTNATISARDRQGLLPKVTFYPMPSSGATLFYDAVMRLPALVTDNDMSLMPEQYHDAIEDYCMYRGYRHKKDFASANASLQMFKERIQEAIADDTSGPSREIIVGGGRSHNYLGEGTLPGMYPNY